MAAGRPVPTTVPTSVMGNETASCCGASDAPVRDSLNGANATSCSTGTAGAAAVAVAKGIVGNGAAGTTAVSLMAVMIVPTATVTDASAKTAAARTRRSSQGVQVTGPLLARTRAPAH